MAGFVNSINTSLPIDINATRPYTFGWILGSFIAGTFFIALSLIFPYKPSFIDRAVLPDEIYLRNGVVNGVDADSNELNPGYEPTEKKRHWSEKFL